MISRLSHRNGFDPRTLHLIFRVGIAACFIGHGAFGILRKEAWLPFFQLVGLGPDAAFALMPVIGVVDIGIGILALVRPSRALLAYAAVWCLWTAALRPLTGLGVWEMLERAGNYGVPLAFLALVGTGRGLKGWAARIEPREQSAGTLDRTFRVLQGTTALLLVGHGALALAGKPLLATHAAVLGLAPDALVPVGALEILLAAAVMAVPHPGLFVGVALWKVGTEALFVVAGSPFWEVVERGGSYVAPVAASLIFLAPAMERGRSVARIGVAGTFLTVAAGLGFAAPGAVAGQQQNAQTLVDALREGGRILACRHAITDRSRGDDRRVDFGDPGTQRILSESGVRQARALGEELRRLEIPVGEVLASPFQRTFASAELMFGRGRAIVEPRLSLRNWSRDAVGPLFREKPEGGANRVLMTHQGLLYGMLNLRRGSVAEGECVVVLPSAGDRLRVEGQLKLEDWRAAG